MEKKHNPGTELKGKYVTDLQMGLATFFKPGYDKYTDELRAECGLDPVDSTTSSNLSEVAECINALLQKYGIIVSGGFVLKYISPMDDKTKSSIDCDMYVPHTAPIRYPNMYDIMAKLFCYDIIPEMHGRMHYDIEEFLTQKMSGARTGFFQKNGIFSVHKHKRNVNGIYAEMDLVRANLSRTPENIVRNFDLSVCMNWYDGEKLFCMDPNAIFHRESVPGFLHFGYVPIYLGLASKKMISDSRGRILKYIMRGYRIQYLNPHSGELTEITPGNVPNALEKLIGQANRDNRPKVLQKALLKMSPQSRRKLLQTHKQFQAPITISPVKKKETLKQRSLN